MKAILVLTLIIAVCVFVIFILIKLMRKGWEDNEALENDLKTQRNNAKFLVKHAEELAKLEKENATILQEIDNAEDDDEITNIISRIICTNNSRVQDNAKG